MNQIEKVARAMAEQANDYDADVLQWECWLDSAKAAIAAMQPAPQDPVAWMYTRPQEHGPIMVRLFDFRSQPRVDDGWTETPLYAHPPAQWQGIESAPPPPNTRVFLAWRDLRDGKWLIEAAPYETGERVGPYSNVSRHGSVTNWLSLPTPPAGGSDEVR